MIIREVLARGASPRERRNHFSSYTATKNRGRISARAEEPAGLDSTKRLCKAHLRASGGTSLMSTSRSTTGGASPRERRNHEMTRWQCEGRGRISARAEEPMR